MNVKDSSPRQPGYFICSSAEEPERGPLTLENLRDLAEFQHLTPTSLVRFEDDERPRLLSELPELFAEVFPQQEKLHFKPHQEKKDSEAHLAPVDVRDFYRCDMSEASAAPGPPPLSSPATDAGSRKDAAPLEEAASVAHAGVSEWAELDPEAVLKESLAAERLRRPERKNSPVIFANVNFLFLLRWGLALLLVALGFWLWSSVHSGVPPLLALLLGMFPMVGAIALTATDIIDWGLNMFERAAVREPPEPLDYGEAEACFTSGDWAGATAAYSKLMEQEPRGLRVYVEGIAAAVAADNEQKLAVFQASALKHLGPHDRNLLAGSLHRRGLPPLPAKK